MKKALRVFFITDGDGDDSYPRRCEVISIHEYGDTGKIAYFVSVAPEYSRDLFDDNRKADKVVLALVDNDKDIDSSCKYIYVNILVPSEKYDCDSFVLEPTFMKKIGIGQVRTFASGV